MTPKEFADKYLTPPVRLRYIYNLKNYRRLTLESKLKGDEEFEVLNWAFCWAKTPEGRDYWEEIQDRIVCGKMTNDINQREHNRTVPNPPRPIPEPEWISYPYATTTIASDTSSTSSTAIPPRFGGWRLYVES